MERDNDHHVHIETHKDVAGEKELSHQKLLDDTKGSVAPSARTMESDPAVLAHIPALEIDVAEQIRRGGTCSGAIHELMKDVSSEKLNGPDALDALAAIAKLDQKNHPHSQVLYQPPTKLEDIAGKPEYGQAGLYAKDPFSGFGITLTYGDPSIAAGKAVMKCESADQSTTGKVATRANPNPDRNPYYRNYRN